MLKCILVALLLAGSTAAADATIIYSNDFSSATPADANAAGFTGAHTIQTAPDGTTFLGFLTKGATTGNEADLALSGLPVHSSVTLSFDMYALLSLDGDGAHDQGVGDYFKVVVNGSTVLLNDTFSNGQRDQGVGPHEPFQSYGGPGLSGVYFAKTGSASESDTAFGYCIDISNGCSSPGPNETTYKFSFTLNDSASSILFSFIGNATNEFPDEAFGIDNVVVTTAGPETASVPEPSTLALFGFGLLALLGACRKPAKNPCCFLRIARKR